LLFLHFPTYHSHTYTGYSQSTTSYVPGYSTTVPGKQCDHNGGIWDKSDNVQVPCESDGPLVTHDLSTPHTYCEVFFEGTQTGDQFSSHYFVQVDARIATGDEQTWVMLAVHQQEKYGDYSFRVGELGSWAIDRDNSIDGSPTALAMGFLSHP